MSPRLHTVAEHSFMRAARMQRARECYSQCTPPLHMSRVSVVPDRSLVGAVRRASAHGKTHNHITRGALLSALMRTLDVHVILELTASKQRVTSRHDCTRVRRVTAHTPTKVDVITSPTCFFQGRKEHAQSDNDRGPISHVPVWVPVWCCVGAAWLEQRRRRSRGPRGLRVLRFCVAGIPPKLFQSR
jgi:hypothetical protein